MGEAKFQQKTWVNTTVLILIWLTIALCLVYLGSKVNPMLILPLLAVIGIGCSWFLPATTECRQISKWYTILGLVMAVSIGVIFRLRYFFTLPTGYNFEPLNFLFFAEQLIDKRIPYIPFAWYAHTFYSYLIVPFMLLIDNPLTAFRVTNFFISVSALIMMYVFLKKFVNGHAAWIGAALLGASYWHVWASRNGYHQFLLPPLQLLLLYGMVSATTNPRARYFVLAGTAMILGLHAHYGFYLMPGLVAMYILYLLCCHRHRLKAMWKPMAITLVLTVVCLVPLMRFYANHPKAYSYITNRTTDHKTHPGEVVEKLETNYIKLVWYLSGLKKAVTHAEAAPVVNILVALSALAGFVLAIRRFRRSPVHAALIFLLLVNMAGLCIMIAGIFYVIAMMAAVYTLAAIGLNEWVCLLSRSRKHAVIIPGYILLMGCVGGQAVANYTEMFSERPGNILSTPFKPPGIAYLILPDIQHDLVTHDVYLPFNELRRDFEKQIFKLGDVLEYFDYMQKVQFYNYRMVLFPPPEGKQGVILYLPDAQFVRNEVLEILRKMYPHLSVASIFSPPPYDRRSVILKITIPQADLLALDGFEYSGSAGGSMRDRMLTGTGVLRMPKDLTIRFRVKPDREGRLWLHHNEIMFQGGLSREIFLPEGMYPIRVETPTRDLCGFEVSKYGGDWQPLEKYVMHFPPSARDVESQYLSRITKDVDWFYRLDTKVHTGRKIMDTAVNEAGEIAVLYPDQHQVFSSDGQPLWMSDLPEGQFKFTFSLNGQWMIIREDGAIYHWSMETRWEYRETLNMRIKNIDTTGSVFAALSRDGRIAVWEDGRWFRSQVQDRKISITDFALAPNGFHIFDYSQGNIIQVDRSRRQETITRVANISNRSEIASDSDGILYLKTWDQGILGFDAQGNILKPVEKEMTQMFYPFTPGTLNHLEQIKFTGTYAAGFIKQQVYVFERVTE